jgi:acetyl-CoA C-acetyltransferase
LDVAEIDVDQVATFDLYSCFPIAVFVVAEALGLAADDPRGLTVTGGLPFFGGAGNNYSMHAIAETVRLARRSPGSFGFVGANGGTLSKYSVGIYSTHPTHWRSDHSATLQRELDAAPVVGNAFRADGWASIETYTVIHRRSGGPIGVVIGRLQADGQRFVAATVDGDEELLQVLSVGEPIGQRVFVRSFGFGNRVTATRERMAELFPVRPPALRDRYEFVDVHRDGHLLEVTINRPDVHNSLHPIANEELAEIFDAYFADPDLWVAILTGAGDQAFCAGNDLSYAASGKPNWMPLSGYAGLTSRVAMNKPVIAAVNGYAMGGGLEIALACHLIVADAKAQLAPSEVKVGLIAGAGGLVRLPRLLPPKVATEMILTGRSMSAQEALQWGLIAEVAEAGCALPAARKIAERILRVSPTSVRISLELMDEIERIPSSVDAALHRSRLIDELMASADAVEGMRAFADKTDPSWQNR